MSERPLLSAVMIVKNEEERLGKCLESLRGVAQEICIVDTGSTDGTVRIAQRYGAKIDFFPWNGNESDARNRAVAMATGEWLFTIDADEVVSPDLASELQRRLPEFKGNGAVGALALLLRNHYSDGSRSLSRATRIGRNDKAFRFNGSIHPEANYRAGVEALAGALDHYGYLWTPKQRRTKGERTLERLRPLVQCEHPKLAHLCQFLIYLLIAERGGELDVVLERIGSFPGEVRVAEPYWQLALADLLNHYVAEEDFESGVVLAEEARSGNGEVIAPRFYLLQAAVWRKAWKEVWKRGREFLKVVDQPLRPGNPFFPDIQIPAAQAWLWMAESLLKRDGLAFCPEGACESRTVPALVCVCLERESPEVVAEPGLVKLLRFGSVLASGRAPAATVEQIRRVTVQEAELVPFGTAEHLLANLLAVETGFRLGDVPAALKRAGGLLGAYRDHRWLTVLLDRAERRKDFSGLMEGLSGVVHHC